MKNSEPKKDDFEKKTSKIDKLINKINSGKNAWEAGKLFSEIKDNKEYEIKGYANFKQYCIKELRTNENKANSYIRIYLTYDESDVSETVLTAHLLMLARKDDDIRNAVLAAAQKIDAKYYVNSQPEIPGLENSDNNQIGKRPPYDTGTLELASTFLETAKSNRQKITTEKAEKALKVSMVLRDIEKSRLDRVQGLPLKSLAFPQISSLFETMPTNESCLIALFCTMFHLIRKIEFKFGAEGLICFLSIIYVRTPFPDAKIKVFIKKNRKVGELLVEFEHFSQNYLTHKHEKCDLIICWINNITEKNINKDLNQFGVKIPPILAIKEILDTGKITLR